MGLRKALRLYRGCSREAFQSAVSSVAATSLGAATVEWNTRGSRDGDLRTAHDADIHTLYLPYQDADFLFCTELGRRLATPWVTVRIQEESIWDYSLHDDGVAIGKFSVCPRYWEEDAPLASDGPEQAAILSQAWRIPAERIVNYLVDWEMSDDEDSDYLEFGRKGKAYADDVAEYGDVYQFFDFLRALGGSEPMLCHRIVFAPDSEADRNAAQYS